jgi:putative ABC transport system permease protein
MIKTAYNFLKYDKPKSIGVIIGIVICIFLIGQQIGILTFLTGLMGGLIENSDTKNAQIWVVDKITVNANELARLDESLVREVKALKVLNPHICCGYGQLHLSQVGKQHLLYNRQ